jgi:hypothetical protein
MLLWSIVILLYNQELRNAIDRKYINHHAFKRTKSFFSRAFSVYFRPDHGGSSKGWHGCSVKQGAEAERQLAEAAGGNELLPKPFTRDHFRQVLQTFL